MILPKIAFQSNPNRFSFPLQQEIDTRKAETTFRRDFQTPGVDFRPATPIQPPLPASIIISNKLNVDDVYKSGTQDAYRNPNVSKDKTMLSVRNSNHHTNFKMDSDYRIDGFCTSNQLEYPSKPIHSPTRIYKFSVLKLSDPGPLGNKTSIPKIKSEYLDSFTVKTVDVNKSRKDYNADHIRADIDHSKAFITTTMETFQGTPKQEDNSLSHCAQLQQKRITSIPFGDQNKEKGNCTSSQESYQAKDLSERNSYNKWSAHDTIHSFSVRLGDPIARKSGAARSIRLPLYKNTERTLPIEHERNASSLPAGDLNASRVKERLSQLTSRKMHPKPPPGSFLIHVDSSCFHTHSSVHFGQTRMVPSHQSTVRNSYYPIKISLVEHVHAPRKDNIPFDYPGNMTCSTACDSYRPKIHYKVDKPNPLALENLKRSHWQLPDMGIATYCTTHQTHFKFPSIQ